MNKFFFAVIIVFVIVFESKSQTTREEYIKKYHKIAIQEMKRTQVPASITLAQALLESDNGNSYLAKNANNHFGIKCHTWNGEKIYRDDDQKNECFRKYKSVLDSYKDHSDFLVKGKRYAFLFEIKKHNYKEWAKGLKQAGYATNPKYPEMLIKIIEDNNLAQYDNTKTTRKHEQLADIDSEIFISTERYQILLNNNRKYIKAKADDTPERIAKELNMNVWQILKYNDFDKKYEIKTDEMVYIQPKRSKADSRFETHTVLADETPHSISQKYGIKRKALLKYNNLDENSKISEGQNLKLKK